jgi:hypothetical protein
MMRYSHFPRPPLRKGAGNLANQGGVYGKVRWQHIILDAPPCLYKPVNTHRCDEMVTLS